MVNTWDVDVSPEVDDGEPRVCREADRLVYGARGVDYGHPLDDYERTAQIANALVSHKLKEPLTAEDIIRMMIGVKLSRDVHLEKRDNRVDVAGYAECLERVRTERARRSEQSAKSGSLSVRSGNKGPEPTSLELHYQERARRLEGSGGA